MAWIKRNLVFVILVVLGIGATGYCGYLLYSALNDTSAAYDALQQANSSLNDLRNQNPYPSDENIKIAVNDQKRAQAFLDDFRKAFAGFPPPPHMDDRQFKEYLQKTVTQFGLDATNAGVGLTAGYQFSFSAQMDKLTYPAEEIGPWLQEIEEMKVILRTFYNAKVNFFEHFKRPSAGPDDVAGDDIISQPVTSNQWGVVTPYMVTYRAFSSEIANVLAGFAASSNCFIVKAITVTPSKVPLPEMTQPQQMVAAPQPMYRPPPNYGMDGMGSRDYRGGGGRGMPGGMMPQRRPQIMQAPPPETLVPSGPVTILTETPLFVTMFIDVVKLKSAAAPAAPAARPKPPER